MANLTLSIDDQLLQAARIRAVTEGTSVNEICRKAIENYARAASKATWWERYEAIHQQVERERQELGPPLDLPKQTRQEMWDQIIEDRMPTYFGREKKTESGS